MNEPDLRKYHCRAFCKKCGWSIFTPHGDIWHADMGHTCPICGTHKLNKGGWVYRNVRWVSSARWHKPSTWNTGLWVDPLGVKYR